MNKYLFFVFLTILVPNLSAQEHPINKQFDKCLGEYNYSDLGNLECLTQALTDWDKQLNLVYKKLQSLHNDEMKQVLKDSQIKWLKYRDSEFLFIEKQVEGREGTMYPTYVLGKKVEIVKHRVLELESYLSFYSTFAG